MAAAPPARPPPNPRPLLAVLLGVAFLGSSCQVQKIFAPPEAPSEQAVAKQLADLGQVTPGDPAGERAISAGTALLAEQVHVAKRFRPYAAPFALALAIAYGFVVALGLRAWGRMPGAARPLAIACLAVLPARVAIAAIDLATTEALGPATAGFARALADLQAGALPADQAAAVIRAFTELAPRVSIALQLGLAVLVCALFHYAWRYFQRPEVTALLEPPRNPSAGPR